MTDREFVIKLIFNSNEIPELDDMSEEAKLNTEVAVKIVNGIHHVRNELHKKFVVEIEKAVKEKLPDYKTQMIGAEPYNVIKFQHFPYGMPLIIYKSHWEISEEAFKKLINAKNLTFYERPVLFHYGIELLPGKSMFYGIRKGSDKVPYDREKFAKLLGLPVGNHPSITHSEWWPIIRFYDDKYNFSIFKYHSGQYINWDTMTELVAKGQEMIDYYVGELTNFVRQTEDKLDKFIREYKEEHELA